MDILQDLSSSSCHSILLATVFSIVPLLACKHEKGHEPAEAHYALPGLDHGLLQSPVNILSGKAKDTDYQIALNFRAAEPDYLSNTGHSVQLDFPRGSTIAFNGEEYELKQVHFHTPSEHQIDGVTFPMELHVVNIIEPKGPKDPPRYLVIALLYRMGRENAFIARFLEQVPKAEGGQELGRDKVYVGDAVENLRTDYYHYRGSLTTPPYTETVDWLVAKNIFEASPDQIRRINAIEGDNARHVQALHGRTIEQ